jgi:hypothetical protein
LASAEASGPSSPRNSGDEPEEFRPVNIFSTQEFFQQKDNSQKN